MKRAAILYLFLLAVTRGFAIGETPHHTITDPFIVNDIYYEVHHYWETNSSVIDAPRRQRADGPNYGVGDIGGGGISNSKWWAVVVKSPTEYRLTHLVVPETIEYEGKTISVTAINDSAFYNNIWLYSVYLPQVSSIGESAFEGCPGLCVAKLKYDLKVIGKKAFANCTNLTVIESITSSSSSNMPLKNIAHVIISFGSNEGVIGDSAFAGCKNLTNGSFHIKNLGNIHKFAFRGCQSLKSVRIPNMFVDSYTHTIESNAYMGCTNLESVYTEHEGDIAEDAFDEETYQNAILHVPEGKANVYKSLSGWKNFKHFYGDTPEIELEVGDTFTAKTVEGVDMVFEVRDAENKTCWVGCDDGSQAISTSTPGTVTIPNVVNGYEVKGISPCAFMDCNKLTGVVVPEGIEDITAGAFARCYNLTQLELPNSLTLLWDFAFYDCKNLVSVSLGNQLESLGEGAFYGCSSLESVELPSSLTYIYSSVFRDCSRLTEIHIPKKVKYLGNWIFAGSCGVRKLTVDENNPYFYSINNCILEDTDFDGETVGIVDYGCTGSMIPTDTKVKLIGASAFSAVSGITELLIPDNITEIGQNAFALCADLEKITIGRNVSIIQPFAFSRNKKLKEVYVLNPVPVDIADNVFHTEFVWNEDGSFNTSKDFTTATLYVPYGSKNAYQEAAGWKNFQSIVEMEPASPNITFADAEVKRICVENWDTNGDGDLSEDEAAAVINLDNVFKKNTSITKFTELRFFTGLEIIGQSDFEDCDNLSEVLLPNSMRVIGHSAFYGSGLESMDIPYGVTRIEDYAFRYCRSLKNVTIPNSVTHIGEDALESCDNLVSISIPASVTSLYSSTLGGCASLKEIVVDADNPNYMSSDGILYNKDKTKLLTYPAGKTNAEYTVPTSVNTIDRLAFYYTQYLRKVTIHKNVASIGWFAFISNKPISSVTVESEVPIVLLSEVFSSKTESEGTLYVPYGSKSAYQQAEGWKNFQNIVEMEAQEPDLRVMQFYIEGDGIVGTEHTIYYKVTNYGATYHGNVYIHAKELTASNDSWAVIWSYDIEPNKSFANHIGLTFFNEGSYRIWLSTDEEGDEILDEITWDTTPAAVLTAKNYTREYGEENPYFEYTADKGGWSGTPYLYTDATKYSDVGTYPIYITKGTVDNNYVTYQNGWLTITKAPLTVKAISYYMRQEGQMPDYSATYYTFKNGEDESVLLKGPQFNCSVTPYSAMGDYTIYVSGVEAKNYEPYYETGIVRLVGRAGDVNRDTYVNTTDAVDVIQYLLGYDVVQAKYDADLNLDDEITSTDLSWVVYYILNNDRGASRLKTPAATGNCLMGLTLDRNGQVAVSLQNDVPVVAFQFDVVLPEGADISKVLLSEARKNGHSVAMKQMENGCYRVLAYSMQNNTLMGNDGLMATLHLNDVDGEVVLTNIHVTDAQLADYALPDVSLSIQTGITTLTQTTTFDIYDLNGRLVRRNATSTKGLHSGIYVINNQKVVIK